MQCADQSNGHRGTQKSQMTSNDLRRPQKIELVKPVAIEVDAVCTSHAHSTIKVVNKKCVLRVGENVETDGEYVEEILHKFNL